MQEREQTRYSLRLTIKDGDLEYTIESPIVEDRSEITAFLETPKSSVCEGYKCASFHSNGFDCPFYNDVGRITSVGCQFLCPTSTLTFPHPDSPSVKTIDSCMITYEGDILKAIAPVYNNLTLNPKPEAPVVKANPGESIYE